MGSFLDPVADKVLVTTMVVALAIQNMIPLPLAVLIISRDLLLIAGGFMYRAATKPTEQDFFDTTHKTSFEVKPTMISKINTAGQLLLVGCTLAEPAWGVPPLYMVEMLGYGVGVTTLWSGISYLNVARTFKHLGDRDKEL